MSRRSFPLPCGPACSPLELRSRRPVAAVDFPGRRGRSNLRLGLYQTFRPRENSDGKPHATIGFDGWRADGRSRRSDPGPRKHRRSGDSAALRLSPCAQRARETKDDHRPRRPGRHAPGSHVCLVAEDERTSRRRSAEARGRRLPIGDHVPGYTVVPGRYLTVLSQIGPANWPVKTLPVRQTGHVFRGKTPYNVAGAGEGGGCHPLLPRSACHVAREPRRRRRAPPRAVRRPEKAAGAASANHRRPKAQTLARDHAQEGARARVVTVPRAASGGRGR